MPITTDTPLAHLFAAVEAVLDNNDTNDAKWSDWQDASDVSEVYGTSLDGGARSIINRAIKSEGRTLYNDLRDVEMAEFRKAFSGPRWDRLAALKPVSPQTAAAVSDLLNGDGQCWTARDGRTFDELVDAARCETDGDRSRYTFPDGSIITVAGEAWDFGYADCWCWGGAVEQEGHRCTDGID